MRTIIWEYYTSTRDFKFEFVALGDIHLGSAACDEDLLAERVEYIAQSGCRWVGMGDFAEFIQMSDRRFDIDSLADWVETKHLADICGAQRERFLNIIKPIAGQCIGLIEGNHERAIKHYYERDLYREIVYEVMKAGNIRQDLSLGPNGWLMLRFYRENGKGKTSQTFKVNLHHGFVGGRLAGAKALNMQRWLWTHDCDIAVFGHSHTTSVQVEAIETVTRTGKVVYKSRVGCFSGTFMKTSEMGKITYSEAKGYLPMPLGGVRIILRPFQATRRRVGVEVFH